MIIKISIKEIGGLLVLICLTSCFKKKCQECILFEREWYINTLVKNTQNDIKDSIYFKITKDTITETKYSYDMSGNTIKEVSKIPVLFELMVMLRRSVTRIKSKNYI